MTSCIFFATLLLSGFARLILTPKKDIIPTKEVCEKQENYQVYHSGEGRNPVFMRLIDSETSSE
jgi:hypothetical protein